MIAESEVAVIREILHFSDVFRMLNFRNYFVKVYAKAIS